MNLDRLDGHIYARFGKHAPIIIAVYRTILALLYIGAFIAASWFIIAHWDYIMSVITRVLDGDPYLKNCPGCF